MEAMIFAAGLGTRLKEETYNKPKALVKVGKKTLLQLAIEKLNECGVDKIVVNVHHFSELIVDFINSSSFEIPVFISDESEKLLNTGGGLKKAEYLFTGNEPILLYNVDVLSSLDIRKVLNDHLKTKALATLVVRNRKTMRYFKFNKEKRLVGWMNKKSGERKIAVPDEFDDAKEMAFSGIHIVRPEIFKLMPKDEFFSLPDLYIRLAKDNIIKGYYDNSELWMDVGKTEELLRARAVFNKRC